MYVWLGSTVASWKTRACAQRRPKRYNHHPTEVLGKHLHTQDLHFPCSSTHTLHIAGNMKSFTRINGLVVREHTQNHHLRHEGLENSLPAAPHPHPLENTEEHVSAHDTPFDCTRVQRLENEQRSE